MTCLNLSGIIRLKGSYIFAVSAEEKQVSYKMFLSEPLRAEFKSLCALEGVSMNKVLVELVEKWVHEKRQAHRDKIK